MLTDGESNGVVHERASVRDALAAVVSQAERVARVEVHLVVEKAKQDFQKRLHELAAKSARRVLGGVLLGTGYALVVGAAVSALSLRVGAWQAFLMVAAVHLVAGAILSVSPSESRDKSAVTTRRDER